MATIRPGMFLGQGSRHDVRSVTEILAHQGSPGTGRIDEKFKIKRRDGQQHTLSASGEQDWQSMTTGKISNVIN